MTPISGYIKVAGCVVLAGACVAALVKTYDFGYRNAQTAGATALANYKAQVDGKTASSVSAAFADYASGVARGQAAEGQFFVNQHAADTRAVQIKEQIDAVSQPHITAVIAQHATAGSPGVVQPVRECVFSRGFVSLWNAAAGSTGDAGHTVQTGTDSGSTAVAADTDTAADSGVSQADILDWLVDFANVKHADEDKLAQIAALQPPPDVPVAASAVAASTVAVSH